MNRTRSPARSLDQLDLFNQSPVSQAPAIELQIPITVPYGGGIEEMHRWYGQLQADVLPNTPSYGVRTNAKKPIAGWLAELFDVNQLGDGKIVSNKILHGNTSPGDAYREYRNAITRLHIVKQNGIVPEQVTYATQKEVWQFTADAWYADPLMYKNPRPRFIGENNPALKHTWYARQSRRKSTP